MFLSKNRRTRVVAVALLAALIFPLATASADYWEGGARTNGNPINGYALDLYAEISAVAGPIRAAYQNWRAVNILRVSAGLQEYPLESGSSVDVVMYEPAYLIGTYSDGKGVPIAETVPFVKEQNGDLVDARIKHPANWVDINWEHCAIVIFETGIIRKRLDWTGVDRVIPPYAAVAESIMTHEIGHSLKLAHPRLAPGINNGEGSGVGTNRPLPTINSRTIMERSVYKPFVEEPLLYDRQEMQAKWGPI